MPNERVGLSHLRCSARAPPIPANIVAVVGFLIFAWYLYQIASRKKEMVLYKIRGMIVSLVCYLGAVYVLARQKLPPLEAVAFGALIGFACSSLLVRRPSDTRRIPKRIRQQVIARDLTSKGLKWDATKYHIDHIVPFSRGGDNSLRNLRVTEKERNLRKGGRMPGLLDFLRK